MNIDISKNRTSSDSHIKDQSPLFIVGCGRSGTTLLRTMMNHHRDIAIPLESLFIVDYLRAGTRCDLSTIKDLIVQEYELREWGIAFTRNDLDHLSSIKEIFDYLHKRYAKIQGKTRWGQKTPRFVRHGSLLLKYYPHALFIHVIRDPRAVASSFLRSRAHRSNVLFASKRWLMDVRAGLDLKRKFPDNVLEIRYEELVSNTKSILQTICDFIGVSFDKNMLQYHEKGYSEYSRYYYSLHRKLDHAPDTNRINAWRSSLSHQQLRLIEQICSSLMQRLKYKPETSTKPSRIYLTLLNFERLLGICLQGIHYLHYRKGYIHSFLRRKYMLGLLLEDFLEVNY
ncbi:sulfotransferase [Thermodesulfobacteriota bacterium]